MNRRTAKVITFYSYKGGTGRSMAMANVAWILAANGKRVLCIDWDLEAPGLHRYFAPFLIDTELFSTDGVIDYVWAASEALVTPGADPAAGAAGEARAIELKEVLDPEDYIVAIDWEFPEDGVLHLMPAGRQGAGYAERVNAFDWDQFYERLGGGRVLNTLRRQLVEESDYDYVLIDSRTGVSDTSGICTVQMPDTLVVLFTLNKQSMRGSEAIAQSVREQRPDIPIFPVPTRVDQFEADKLRAALRTARSIFAPFVHHLVERETIPPAVEKYWGEVEFPYVPYFAYEEVLAPFADDVGRRTTLLAAATRLAEQVTGEKVAEPVMSEHDRARCLRAYAYESAPLQQAVAVKPAPLPAAAGMRVSRRGRVVLAAAVALVTLVAAGAWFTKAGGPAPTRAEQVAGLTQVASQGGQVLGFVEDLYSQSRDFQGVVLTSALLAEVKLPGADMRGADLRGANLAGAMLDSADLRDADLRGAKLGGAQLRWARLEGAKLDSADLAGANLYGATVDAAALLAAKTTALTILNDSSTGPYASEQDRAVQAAPAAAVRNSVMAYVWIGNYDRAQGAWQKVMIADSTNTPVATDPKLLALKQPYYVLGNLTARDALPKNDDAYYRTVAARGWVPRGSRVLLLSRPEEYTRKSGLVQYWARIEVDSVRGWYDRK